MDDQKLLHAIIENAIDGIITMDDRGIIETLNPAALKLFGYAAGEVTGKNISVLMPEPNKSAHDGYLNRYQRTGEKRIIGIGREVLGLRKDGKTFPFRLGVSEVVYENRIIYTGFIHDLSKEKQAEKSLKSSNENFEKKVKGRTKTLQTEIGELKKAGTEANSSLQKQKELNNLKTRFVSMASHEFRTPLSSIQLSASLINKYLAKNDGANVEKHTATIKNSVRQLTGILNDFLSLEKLEAGKSIPKIASFDMVLFAEELIAEMQLFTKQEQHIVYQHTGTASMVDLDRELLKNALVNLISNAIKYSGANTFIEVNTEITDAEFCITVKDNGIGIPAEEQQQLFEPFFRAHNTGAIPGTGLGLNIVKRYVELMDGAVFYKSTLDVGTTIRLIFKQG